MFTQVDIGFGTVRTLYYVADSDFYLVVEQALDFFGHFEDRQLKSVQIGTLYSI